MKNDKAKDKNKGRYLSPSFHKGAVKEKKKDEKEEKDKNNIVPVNKYNKEKSKEIQRRSSIVIVPEECKVNANKNGRIQKFATLSKAGKGEDGFTKVNQDSYFVLDNMFNFRDVNIFSVLDGHGVNGHLVSRFVTKYFTSFFNNNKKIVASNDSEDSICYRFKKNNYDILKKAFRHAERNINKHTDIDANFSGTTCVMVLQVGEKIICANVGDSRAIIVKGNNYMITPLSIDQKPTDPEESKRIIASGGEISQFEEDGEKSGPYRVWKKGEEYPGIAMSRSIGDFVASSLGVIPEPIFIEDKVDKDTKFIVIASDGVWEFLDNQAVTDIVLPFYKKNDPNGACRALIKESTDWWNKEDIVVDDITVIIVFF